MRRRRRALDMLSVAILLLALVANAGPIIGRVEGWVAPVAERFTVSAVMPSGSVGTRIWGEFDLVRICDFRDIDAWLVGPERTVSVPVLFEEGTKERPLGPAQFGPWLLAVTPEQLPRVRAEALHHCGGPRWWLTRTPLISD